MRNFPRDDHLDPPPPIKMVRNLSAKQKRCRIFLKDLFIFWSTKNTF